MINIEGFVYSSVVGAWREAYPGMFVSGEGTAAPSTFPAGTVVEEDNSFYLRAKDLTGAENYAQVMYSVNVYSNLSSGRKSQCKALMAIADAEMSRLGFVRTGSGPMNMPNADNSIYRMVARYKAVVSKSGAVHRII